MSDVHEFDSVMSIWLNSISGGEWQWRWMSRQMGWEKTLWVGCAREVEVGVEIQSNNELWKMWMEQRRRRKCLKQLIKMKWKLISFKIKSNDWVTVTMDGLWIFYWFFLKCLIIKIFHYRFAAPCSWFVYHMTLLVDDS